MTNMLTKANLIAWGKILLLFAFVGLMFSKGFHQTPKTAPDLKLTTITGKSIQLSTLRGRPVLVNFWATSCASCLDELPALVNLYQTYHAQGLELIAIAMAYDPPNRVVNLSKNKQLPYDIVLDVNGDHAKAFGGIWAIPTTFVIAPDGTVNKREVGIFDINTMQQRLEQLLKG